MDNHESVTKGFGILNSVLAPYIAQSLSIAYGKDWWRESVLWKLRDEQKRGLPADGDWGDLVDSLDVAACLTLLDIYWNDVFKKKLSIDHRTWAKELQGTRNRWAHIGGQDFSDDDAWRALDTMARLCEQLDSEKAEEIRGMLREVRYGSVSGSTSGTSNAVPQVGYQRVKSAGVLQDMPLKDLPSWRDVIEPHHDVALGLYKNAEFAADLAQVARGDAALEYGDPVEFFSRTYVTEGMTGLLVQALRRINGKDGEPVIQLKTAFGGGKTHSMLALYHMMRGRVSIDKIPNIKPVLQAAGVTSLPKANVAVIVGTALDPSKSRRPIKFPGITISTIWGEIAAQLAESAEKPEVYDYVKEADKKGVTPGSEALKNLLDACGPCLILMDELVAYARKLYERKDLPAGTFDNFLTFIQEITEAARASKNSLVVASIPESDLEVGGDSGHIALEMIEKTFGRMESIWKPVAASEGFEVVRRRLFLNCKNPNTRDRVCARFSQMYLDNAGDFPPETKEVEYRERMLSCYPIHPEVFDRLYNDWSTLEKFQKTRGVLRLMAAVIHELWMSNDAGLMIMPGSIPLDIPNVSYELTRHLGENWHAIIDAEVDGKKSIPYQKDQTVPRYGHKLASRRVARTIFLGSAPTVRLQNVRGIEAVRIRLGIVQPGENIADFNDSLNTLRTSLAYLYTNASNNRYWYDTRPTLRKTMEDRATQFADHDVIHELMERLGKLKREAPFGGLHICPGASMDVTDEQSARLVILRPEFGFKLSDKSNAAFRNAEDILNNRGTMPRIYRNMLAFVAPDQELMGALKQEVRQYLAWQSISEEKEILNLDIGQIHETDTNMARSGQTVETHIKETYCWLLVPYIDRSVDMKAIVWEHVRLSGGSETIVAKVAKQMLQTDQLISKWAPALLLMQLDELLWKDTDNISIKKLWEYLCTYCYLPRLANFDVLEETIRVGVNSTEYFALAAAVSDGRYVDLRYNKYVGSINVSDLLIKLVSALRQLAEPPKTPEQPVTVYGGGQPADGTGVSVHTPVAVYGGSSVAVTPPVETPSNKRFFMTAQLDNTRINRDVQKLVEEVISHLTSVDGTTVDVSLEVHASAPKGMPQPTVRTVTENCHTLKVKTFGFEE